MQKNLSTSVTILAILGILYAPTSSAHEHFHHAPKIIKRHSVRYYDHIYYPNHHAYYAKEARTWYWFERGRWHSAYNRPYAIRADIGGITLRLSSPIPYGDHRIREQYYGPRIERHHTGPNSMNDPDYRRDRW
ncbi:hypothetical protein [Undibacterium fentianense]|uniref:Uncharacterized protein n=1 Tax=Undibacterium fentianense TaxID=2828728 RepID=A0A941E0C8_9BURK|nr:hypothetical protein [Undibacterium fentianense]MBR7800030.1 hypothetical protein [Undibacterium fentianense]